MKLSWKVGWVWPDHQPSEEEMTLSKAERKATVSGCKCTHSSWQLRLWVSVGGDHGL